MKVYLSVLILILLSSYTQQTKLHKVENNTNKNTNNKTTNNNNNKQDAFALAGTGSQILHSLAGLHSPKIVSSVTSNHTIEPTAINRGNLYYDGTEKLNTVVVECNAWSLSPSNCVNNEKCGWCGDNRTCIPGNSSGPLAPCGRSSYLFTSPGANWNPMNAGTININTEGRTILTDSPNVSGMNIRNPYN